MLVIAFPYTFMVNILKSNSYYKPYEKISCCTCPYSSSYHYWLFLLSNFQKSNPPGSVGTSLALETIIQHSPMDFRPIRYVLSVDFVCFSRLLLNQLCMFELFVYLDRFLSVWFFFSFLFVAEMKLAIVFLFVPKEEGVYWQNAWN